MRRINSVGGHRMYPSSPELSDLRERGDAIIGQFNDGMDQLHRERNLSNREQQLFDRLEDGSPLHRTYQNLTARSNQMWARALQKQEALAQGGNQDVYSTSQLGQHMLQLANNWRTFKNNLNES